MTPKKTPKQSSLLAFYLYYFSCVSVYHNLPSGVSVFMSLGFVVITSLRRHAGCLQVVIFWFVQRWSIRETPLHMQLVWSWEVQQEICCGWKHKSDIIIMYHKSKVLNVLIVYLFSSIFMCFTCMCKWIFLNLYVCAHGCFCQLLRQRKSTSVNLMLNTLSQKPVHLSRGFISFFFF